jgi:uncharacterized protein (UPF0147 family)
MSGTARKKEKSANAPKGKAASATKKKAASATKESVAEKPAVDAKENVAAAPPAVDVKEKVVISPENEQKKKQVIQILTSISEDTSVPRNIRRAANEAITSMEDDKNEMVVRASNGISILDEISQDPNCPLYARTRIWNAVSVLETIKD